MSDKPILFSSPMIRAILSGQKTMTRRILKETVPPAPAMDAIYSAHKVKHPAPYLDSYCSGRKTEQNPRGMSDRWCWWTRDDRQCLPTFKVKYVPCDRLWVRETWKPYSLYAGMKPSDIPETNVFFAADGGYAPSNTPWVPSIFMPRWASRITLEVTHVRVERLQDISEADAISEGVKSSEFWKEEHPPSICYSVLWDHINGAGSWQANPWVVAVDFRRAEAR